MNGDIRISTNMINHTKVKKLIKKHGYEAFYSLICFWSYVAINKPDGNISGLDADDIEIAANWGGEDGVLYDAFCSLGFLDCEDENICIHNWTKHNPYAVGAEGRSLEAKKKQFVRWGCKKLPKNQHESFKEWLYNVATINTNSNTDSILAVYKVYTHGNTPYPVPVPVPSPEPLPLPNQTIVLEGEEPPKRFSVKKAKPVYATDEQWDEYILYRKENKSKNSERAFNVLLPEMQKTINSGKSFEDILNVLSQKKWQGYKHEWFVNCSTSDSSANPGFIKGAV